MEVRAMSGSNEKGWFHEQTGIPFAVWMRGGTATYVEQKVKLGEFIQQKKLECDQQLRLQKDLEDQRRRKEEDIMLLDGALKESQSEFQRIEAERIKVEKRMHERKTYPFKPDVSNAPGAILNWMLSHIPPVKVVLTVKTGVDITRGAYDHYQDKKLKVELREQEETHTGFQDATAQEIQQQAKDLEKLRTTLVAHLNTIKTSQETLAQTQKAADKL
ncbi:hypothetical protein ACE7GA_07095 [Roseomonas sp. CCTCC AB2023176]|uniref:hypothetical protein n=1 Tax=Roseomonas sp. CCTCC AB2023176 TaxID=3342640 RepID=UPI0035D61D64